MSHVLIADDDIALCTMLGEYLELEGFQVSLAHNGEQALATAFETHPDVILLDVMMPKMNGLDVLRALRKRSAIPVLMLTARGDEVDSIVGLELGADDYLGKPGSPRVIVARLRALLRRSSILSSPASSAGLIEVGELCVDPRTRTAMIDGAELILTGSEFNILLTLTEHAGTVRSKSALSESAMGRPLELFDRSIDMHVSHLRKKLGPGSDGKERIKTVRGVGYQLTMS